MEEQLQPNAMYPLKKKSRSFHAESDEDMNPVLAGESVKFPR